MKTDGIGETTGGIAVTIAARPGVSGGKTAATLAVITGTRRVITAATIAAIGRDA